MGKHRAMQRGEKCAEINLLRARPFWPHVSLAVTIRGRYAYHTRGVDENR